MKNWASFVSFCGFKVFPYYHVFRPLLSSFVQSKKRIFAILEAQNIKIPTKTSNKSFLLEELLNKTEKDSYLYKKVLFLIRFREKLIFNMMPFYKTIAVQYLKIKSGITWDKEDPKIEEIVYKALVRSLDRMEKPGFRIDFLFSYLNRLLSNELTREISVDVSTDRDSFDCYDDSLHYYSSFSSEIKTEIRNLKKIFY